MVTDFYSR